MVTRHHMQRGRVILPSGQICCSDSEASSSQKPTAYLETQGVLITYCVTHFIARIEPISGGLRGENGLAYVIKHLEPSQRFTQQQVRLTKMHFINGVKGVTSGQKRVLAN